MKIESITGGKKEVNKGDLVFVTDFDETFRFHSVEGGVWVNLTEKNSDKIYPHQCQVSQLRAF